MQFILWLFFRGQNEFLIEKGFEIHAITSPGTFFEKLSQTNNLHVHELYIARPISVFNDLLSLWNLSYVLRTIKPDIVLLNNAKASFLGAVASWLISVPVRIFLCNGLSSENATRINGHLYRLLERVTAKLCTETICVSESLMNYARSENILAYNEGKVLVNGPTNGIDFVEFDPDSESVKQRAQKLRDDLAIHPTDFVIGFVGRLAKDKGIDDLAIAWKALRGSYEHLKLLLAGYWESEYAELNNPTRLIFQNDNGVHEIGFVEDVAPYYALMNLLVLPSHGTEGFPTAIAEASTMGIPSVGTKVAGCMDAVIDGKTGFLVPKKAPQVLVEKITVYIEDDALRRCHGKAARERALRDFSPKRVWERLHQEYIRSLGEKNLPVPK